MVGNIGARTSARPALEWRRAVGRHVDHGPERMLRGP
ncbi:hypothetical protein Ae406Ps2_0407c [Pseudonocardia sp. Ae406_Ps2]|nr:hypothetical protein Ae406Ps2_0407c [Pseudonocardia sp. Ae406_Ps2]OLM07800.1 hypothetical protein Ae331Ps2_5510 [Pseudonocardia sp. Ae331_Ps2]OLM13953.1 hypothetical protein Ae505Ps2_4082c [Pseudonocardia sp. Ae505_Ps2]OLM21981.1 hypothetical protein Ae706Ps2_0413c [Pseudonocardia sp. Ae706_Ps2]